MDAVITETPTETTEPTSQEVELLIDDEGLMDSDTPTETSTPEESENNDSQTEQKNSQEEEPKPDSDTKELVYDSDEESDKNFVIKVNGENIETSLKELKVLAQKGLNYSQKTMALAKHNDLLNSLEQYGIDSIEALNSFMANNQGETIQEAEKSPYGEDVEQVATEILQQPNAGEFKEVISGLPDRAMDEVSGNSKMLASLYVDFNSGLAQKLLPETKKVMALRPDLSFYDAYQMAGNRIVGATNNKAKAIQQPRNSFVEENSEVLSDKEFQEITARLSGLQ